MAKTTSFQKLRTTGGGIVIQAQGSVNDVSSGGSFSVTLDTAGSMVLRNVQTVILTKAGSAGILLAAKGSSDGYIATTSVHIGSTADGLIVNPASGTINAYFKVTGGGGSI